MGRHWTPWDAAGNGRTPLVQCRSPKNAKRILDDLDWTATRCSPSVSIVGHRWTPLDIVGQRGTPWDNMGHRWTPWDISSLFPFWAHSVQWYISDLERNIKIYSSFPLNLAVIFCTRARRASPLILLKDHERTSSRRDFSFIVCVFGLLLNFPFLRENYCGPVRVYNFSIYSKVLSRENRTLNSLERWTPLVQCRSPKNAKRISDDLHWTAPLDIVGHRWTPWDNVGHRWTPWDMSCLSNPFWAHSV